MANRRGLSRLALLVILVASLFGLASPVVSAGAIGTPSTIHAAPSTVPLSVTKQSTVVDFPTKLEFDLVADVGEPAKSVEVWYHPMYSPVTLVSRPDFAGGTHIDVAASIDMQLHYMPPGVDIVYRWRVTLTDGTILETPEQTVLYMDNRYKWSTVTSGQVTIYYFKGDDQVGKEALNTTVQSIDQFKQTFNIASSEPVRVILYGSSNAFASALPPNSAEWIGGIAEPELHMVLTGIQPGSDATTEIHRILSHEVVHLIVGQVTSNPFNSPPPWLDEGLATYYQEVPDSRFDPALKNAIRTGQLIPVRALNSSFPDDPNQALLSYAESRSIVDFIINQKGADKMAALLQAYAGGVSNDEAVQTGLGISIDQLDTDWKIWLGYGGDRQVSATTNSNHNDTGVGQQINDLLATSSSVLLMGLAALFTIVVGTLLMLRGRHSDREPLEP